MSFSRESEALLSEEELQERFTGTPLEWLATGFSMAIHATGFGLTGHYLLNYVEDELAAFIAGGVGTGLVVGIAGVCANRYLRNHGFFCYEKKDDEAVNTQENTIGLMP